MVCGDPQQASPLPPAGNRVCPRCEAEFWQRYQVSPDLEPRRHRRRCYACGWDSGWHPYEAWLVWETTPRHPAKPTDRA